MRRGNRPPIPIHRFHGMPVAIGDDMKMNRIMAMISIMMLIMISCGEKEKIVNVPVNCAPSSPRGVYSVNYEGTVQICWVANYESDMDGYNVYRSETLDGSYSPIGTVYVNTSNPAEYCFEDLDTANGIHYYYAVSAFDQGGAESDLIVEEVVSGTPRPEGQLTLYDAVSLPSQSGYDFYPGLSNTAQQFDLSTTDIYFGVIGGIPAIVARRVGVEIQDYGYAGSFDAVGYAPDDGWAPSRSAEAIVKHMYILQLLEGTDIHYAKLYVTAITGDHVTFYWAFQTDPGNPDLAPPAPGRGTGALSSAHRSDELPGLTTEAKLTDRFSDPPIVERVTWTRDSGSGHQTTE
jgi:hypothetical protein